MKVLFKVIACLLVMITLYDGVFADDYVIIPEWQNNSTAVNKLMSPDYSKWETVWKLYDKNKSNDVWTQMATWIMDWNTILNFIVYLVKFLSQLALVIWAVMIIYAWYLYGLSVFNGSNVSKGTTAIKNAIIWILIVIFSFSIMKIITSMFLR